MAKSSSWSVLGDDGDLVGVDSWESPDILTAEEAHRAKLDAIEIGKKLNDEENMHEVLKKMAKQRLTEMAGLLSQEMPSASTKEEMEHVAMLDAEIAALKVKLDASKSALKSYREDHVRAVSISKTYELMKTKKDVDVRAVINSIRKAETVDLAFVLDCTGSMNAYIEATKKSMQEIVRRVKGTNPNLKIRVAVVAYRDLADGALHFEELGFTDSVTEFEKFVSALTATGGGDAPEDMAGAIQRANSLSWQQVSRVTFVISDAPCHGNNFHSLGDDQYPNGTPGICIKTELRALMKKGGEGGMQLYFGRITEHCDRMIGVFATNGIKFEVCDLEDPAKLASSVSSSVRKSISVSITASRSKSRPGSADDGGLKDYTICEAKPSKEGWKCFKAVPVDVLCNKPVRSVKDLKVPLPFGKIRQKMVSSEAEERKMFMKRAKDPFAEGEMRLAYYGQLGFDEASLMSSEGDKVLKTFKKKGKMTSERKKYLAQMEVSTIAQFLAQEYNKMVRPSHCPEIRFLSVHVIESKNKTEDRFCAEDVLPCAATSFTKYSNNTGYWNEDEISQSLLLFTLFTFEVTNNYLMVTDLQGVRHGNDFILTDPAILCKDNSRFGGTNLGSKMMDRCINSTKAMLEENGWDD